MQGRILALVAGVGLVVAIDGCGDVTGIKAQFENIDTANVVVHAMTGTPASLPVALLVRATASVPVTAEFNFDLAFDLDDTGAVVIHTVKAIASEFVAAHRVGLDTTAQPFEAVTRAPSSGFVYDSSLTVGVGRTVLVDVFDPSCNIFSLLGTNIFAKLVVDSVKVPERLIYVHLFVDPNCGFHSLTPGTPRE